MSSLSEREVAMSHKVYRNLGHTPVAAIARLLSQAGTKPKVLAYVKSRFACDECWAARGPVSRRPAAAPRTYAFGAVVAVDLFEVSVLDKPV